MVRWLTTGILTAFCLCASAGGVVAQERQKLAYIVVDVPTGAVIEQRSGRERRFPASLTKMMTLYVVFEEIRAGRLRLDTRMKVSEFAASRPPSKLHLKAGSTITVSDAMHALAIRSANDASVVIAEHISGSERQFAQRMNRSAARIGMRNTVFTNASGLPSAAQVTTAYDMYLLGVALQRDFPQHYGIFGKTNYRFNGRVINGHNGMLHVQGVDGIKTGFTNAAGYNIVTNVKRNNRHFVIVIMGAQSGKARTELGHKLIAAGLNWRRTGQPLLAANLSRSDDRHMRPKPRSVFEFGSHAVRPAPQAPPAQASMIRPATSIRPRSRPDAAPRSPTEPELIAAIAADVVSETVNAELEQRLTTMRKSATASLFRRPQSSDIDFAQEYVSMKGGIESALRQSGAIRPKSRQNSVN